MMDIKRILLQWFKNFLIKNLFCLQINLFPVVVLKMKMSQNQELVEELHKPIIRKFQKQTLHSSFIENIWGAALADMQLIIKFNI